MVERIKQLCDERKISITFLEKEIGLGNGTIGKWKTCSPKVDSLIAVAQYFGVTVDSLIEQAQEG